MRELREAPLAPAGIQTVASELAASRLECLELRIALSSLCEAIEGWGQWTMSNELVQAHHHASSLLYARKVVKPGL